MKKINQLVFVVILTFVSSAANAEFIEIDFLTENDKSILNDTSTGLSWLDLDITDNDSYNNTMYRLGADLSQFRLATQVEIENLFLSVFPTLSGTVRGFFDTANQGYADEANNFYSLLGGRSDFLYGVFKDESGTKRSLGVDVGLSWFQGYGNTVSYDHWGDDTPVGTGLFLVSEEFSNVPLPTSIGLLALAMLAFGFRRMS